MDEPVNESNNNITLTDFLFANISEMHFRMLVIKNISNVKLKVKLNIFASDPRTSHLSLKSKHFYFGFMLKVFQLYNTWNALEEL